MTGVVITDDIFASDLWNESLPYRVSLGNAVRSGQWPLWVPEIYGGFPLLARSEAGACYPFNIVLFALCPPDVALNLTILLTVVTAGVGMCLYTREIGTSTLASAIAGVAFAFSGFLLVHLKHLSIANAASWLPVGLLLLERAVERNAYRSLLLAGALFGLQLLAGNPQIAYYCGALYVAYFTLRHLAKERARTARLRDAARGVLRSKLTWCFLGALVLGVLLAAVQLLPTYELVSMSDRSGGVTFEYASRYAYDPADFWTFLYPYRNGDIGNLSYTGRGIFWEDYGYVGVATFLLALSAPLCWWRSWHVRFFSGAALVSYLLVLGPATPLYKVVFASLPGMSYFRFPTRLLVVTDLSLVALAALAVTKLAVGAARFPRARSLIQVALLAAVTADLLHFQLRQNPIADAARWRRTPQTVEIVQRDKSVFRTYCIGGAHSHRKAFEQAGGWQGDIEPFLEQREFIQPSSNVLYGLSSPAGYANLTPRYLVDVWGDQNRAGIVTRTASTQGGLFQPTAAFRKLMRMYNVKYLTSFWPVAPAPDLTALGNYGGAFLYRSDALLPRAYLVGDVVAIPDGPAALETLLSERFAPDRSVLLQAVPPNYRPNDGGRGGKVEILRYSPGETTMSVQASQDQILVFSDSYYPGWVATVDGVETTIYRANVTQRAIVVPGGAHAVRFHFRPRSFVVGLWLSFASFVVLVVGWFLMSQKSAASET